MGLARLDELTARLSIIFCRLLIANMIANETLPIVTEKALGGGIQAIIISTALVIVFSGQFFICATGSFKEG
jgi:hypothetical protein